MRTGTGMWAQGEQRPYLFQVAQMSAFTGGSGEHALLVCLGPDPMFIRFFGDHF